MHRFILTHYGLGQPQVYMGAGSGEMPAASDATGATSEYSDIGAKNGPVIRRSLLQPAWEDIADRRGILGQCCPPVQATLFLQLANQHDARESEFCCSLFDPRRVDP